MAQEYNPDLEAVGLHDVKDPIRMCKTVKNRDVLPGQLGRMVYLFTLM